MREADLALRDQLIKEGTLFDGYHPEMRKLHELHAEQLGAIIEKIGYPTREKVGKEGSEAAWLIIQHAISHPAFMKQCALHLAIAVANHEGDPILLAYLEDRIATFEGRAQRYGTQFDWDVNGEMSPQPYDDIDDVNHRRATIGLEPLKEQIHRMRQRAIKEGDTPPTDYRERKEQYDHWRKEVGWI